MKLSTARALGSLYYGATLFTSLDVKLYQRRHLKELLQTLSHDIANGAGTETEMDVQSLNSLETNLDGPFKRRLDTNFDQFLRHLSKKLPRHFIFELL